MRRAKVESLRGHFDQMKMKEGEDITKYSERIRKCVNVIRVAGRKIDDETMVSKVLRTFLPIYAIIVSNI